MRHAAQNTDIHGILAFFRQAAIQTPYEHIGYILLGLLFLGLIHRHLHTGFVFPYYIAKGGF